MIRLFDHALPSRRPTREPDEVEREEERVPLAPGDAPARVWRHLLERGADPFLLAALLREGVPPAERERAFLELVHSIGLPLATAAWSRAFGGAVRTLQRRAFPVAARELAETATGTPLVGIHVATGELVDLVAARLGTPAFTLGSEVFISDRGGGQAVLVHEAVHAAQQSGAPVAARPSPPSRAAEDEVHRVLRRIGPLDGRDGFLARERARAALAVRAALGRAPSVTSRPVALAAYEPTDVDAASVLVEGQKLAAALERLVARGADAAELKAALGPADDAHAAKLRRVAMHELGLRNGVGATTRDALVARLGADAAVYLFASSARMRDGEPLAPTVRAEIEPLLGRSLAEVRVHDDAETHRRAAQLDAAAFTDGAHIHFASGRFDPHSPAGRRLLAHELAHVAQQPTPLPTEDRAQKSEPGSAAEREADRVAEALTARVAPSPLRERAAAGTISRKEASAPTVGARAWTVQLFHQALRFDPASGSDTREGTRKLELPRARIGPVTLRDAHVKLDGAGQVESGTLAAMVDDGRFRGSLGTLHVDKDGNVTGTLGLVVAIPDVLTKNVVLAVGADGLSATVPLAPADFVAKELPILASDLALVLRQGASGLEAKLTGDATAKLDRGFAGGSGRLTAELSHAGAPALDATIRAALDVRGLKSVADAQLKWDGKRFDLEAAATVALAVPGLGGTARLSYRQGQLRVEVPDLAFAWKPLGDRLRFGAFQVVDGRLVAQVELAQPIHLDLPGVALALDGRTHLAVDGDRLAGVAAGHLALGGSATPILDGDFALHWHDGQLDGEATIAKALLPFLEVDHLPIAIRDLGGANQWSFGRDIEIHFRNLKQRGRWKLPRFQSGSLLGGIHLDFDLPKLKLPSLDFSLLPEWRLALPQLPELRLDLDLAALLGRAGELFGKLPGIKLELGLRATDLFHLGELISEIRLGGIGIPLPRLSFARLETLALKLPGFAGGSLDWSKLSGLFDLKLDLELPGVDIPALHLGIDAGRFVGKLKIDVDVSRILRFLRGTLSIQLDSSLPGLLRIDGVGITLADANLARYALAALHWLGDRLGGSLRFDGELPWRGIKFSVLGGEIKLDDLKPSGFIEVEAAGAKHKATAKLTYDDKGELQIEGRFDLDAATLTNGWLTGVLSVGNYGGARVLAGKVELAKGPLAGKVTDIDARYDVDRDDFSASFHLRAESFAKISGVVISGLDAPIHVRRHDGRLELDGRASGNVKVGSYFDGRVTVGYEHGKLFGEITTERNGLKINLPAAASVALETFKLLLDDELRLRDGDATIGINLHDFIVGELKLHVAGHAITGFAFAGRAAETRFTQPVTDLALAYRDGAWSGHAAVRLKSLGGILDDGAALEVAGSSAAGISVAARDVVFRKGLLEGFKIAEVHFDARTFGGTIAGGGQVRIGPVTASIAPGSTISFDKLAGLGGSASGELRFGNAGALAFELRGNGESIDVVAKARLQLAALSHALEGEVEVGWDSAARRFTFAAIAPGFAHPAVKKIARVEWVKWDGHDFDVKVSIVPGVEFSAGEGRSARVLSGHVAWNRGRLDGEIKGQLVGAGANTTVTAGWRNGEFYLGAGGEFDLGKLTGNQVTGRVQAEGDTRGRARFKLLGEIKIARLPQLTIRSLEGDLQGGHFRVGVDFDSLGKTVAIPMVTLSRLHGSGQLRYDAGAISLDGEVSGAATLNAGGKDVVKGTFALRYHDGEFGGRLAVTEVLLSKKLKSHKLVIDYDKRKTSFTGAFSFAVPRMIHEAQVAPDVDLKTGKLDFSSELRFEPAALKDVTAHLGRKDGKLDLSLAFDGDRPIKVGGARLVLKAGSTLAYDEARDDVSGRLVGAAQLGAIASGEFDVSFADGKLKGELDLKVDKIPLLKAGTEISVSFDDGKLNTKKPIRLELDDTYKQYLDAGMELSVRDNVVTAEGVIREIKKLGKLGKNIRDGRLWYDTAAETIGARGTLDLSSLSFLDKGSQLTLSVDSALNFGVKGELHFKKASGVDLTGALAFEWAPGRFMLSGHVAGSIYGLAEIELHASADKVDGGERATLPESEHLDFHLAGKLTTKGLQKKFKKLRFSREPTVSFWIHGGDGAIDYGMDDFHTTITGLPGIDHCEVDLAASYVKDKGFNASVAIKDLRYKMFKLSGGLAIEESKFKKTELEIESTLKAVNLKGRVAIHAGEMDQLDAEASLDVVAGSGSALKWLESGHAKVTLKHGRLDSVDGKITIRKPPLLPIDKTVLELTKDGENIIGGLRAEFDVPFGKGKKGILEIVVGGTEQWSVAIDAEIKPPGFKTGHIKGKAGGDGSFSVGGSLEAEHPKRIREGRLELGYKDGFFLKGGLTLRVSDTLDGSVDVEYDQEQKDFRFVGEIRPHEKPQPKTYVPIGGFEPDLPDVTLASIGIASLVLELDLAFNFGIIMPYVQFEGLKLVGSLRQLEDGNLPEVSAKARFGMGAKAHFELGVALAGKISLVVATAKAGVRGKLTADAELNAYTDSNVVFGGNHDGVDIGVDATVDGGIDLKAKLEAFLKAKAFGFTIVNETWNLASFDIATLKLPGWKPFAPFIFNVGGSNPGFRQGWPSVRAQTPPGIVDGAKNTTAAANEEAKQEKAKENLKPVMIAILRAAERFERLPPNWQKGLHAEPVNVQSFIGVDKDAWDFYAEKAGDAESWLPDLATKTPAQRMAKAVAIVARHHRDRAGELILAWQRAQLAHRGINPDSGVNLVEERAEIEQLHQERYAKQKAAATAKQVAQDLLFAAAVVKQIVDWQAAELAHEKQIEKTKQQYEAKIAQHKKTGAAAQSRIASAKEHAGKEGVGDAESRATVDKEGGAPTAAPSPPEAPAKLDKPEPLKPKPPIAQPLPPAPLPPVVVPHEPMDVADLKPAGPDPDEDDLELPDWMTPKANLAEPSGAPPDSQAVAQSGGAVGKMGSGGESRKPTGAGAGPGGAGGTQDGASEATPAPAMVEGAGDLEKQGARLDAQLVAAGGEPKNAMRSGDGVAMMAALEEGRREQMESRSTDGAPANAPGGAAATSAPTDAVDPSVRAVVERGKVAEEKQRADAERREAAYAASAHDGERHAGAVESALGGQARQARQNRERHAMPPPSAFPIATPHQIRIAYSNWTRLHLSGETLRSFADRMGARFCFDFETRTWSSIVAAYERMLARTAIDDTPAEPKEFAEKLAAGHSFDGKELKRAAAFDPAFALDDEAIRAEEAIERIRLLYRGCRPADYLVRAVERAEEKRHALAHSLLAPLCESYEPLKALRAALDHLGPSRDVQKQLGIVDAGKLIDPKTFWTRALARFNADESGIAQINDVIRTLQEAKEVAPKVTRVKPAAVSERVGDPNDPPRLAHFTDVAARFEALAAPGAFDALLVSFGVHGEAALAANREAMLATRRRQLAALRDTMKGASPSQVHAAWRDDFRRRSIEHNRMVADLSRRYAAAIAEVRAMPPRLDSRGVAQACALFRARVGANGLIFTIGDLNPAGTLASEVVDPAIAHAHVDGADWNPMLDKTWLESTYERFDSSAFPAPRSADGRR